MENTITFAFKNQIYRSFILHNSRFVTSMLPVYLGTLISIACSSPIDRKARLENDGINYKLFSSDRVITVPCTPAFWQGKNLL